VVELKVYDLSALPESQTRQEIRRRAEREFEALRKLRDTQGIVRVAESFQPVEGYGGELYYLALDLPAGPCLASRLSELSWSFESRFAAAKRLCEIMHAVHQAGVIHRNLSPACIYFWRTESDFQLTGFEFSRLPTTTLQIPPEIHAGPYTLKSDGFSTSINLKPLLSTCSKEVVYQNSLANNFPLGSPSGRMVHTYRSRGGPTMLYCRWLPTPVTNGLHVLRPMFHHRHHVVFSWLLVCQATYQEKATIKGLARLAPRPIAEWHLRRLLTATYGNGRGLWWWVVDQVIATRPPPEDGVGYLVVDRTINDTTGSKPP
jgi:serine/threonine protein kinase